MEFEKNRYEKYVFQLPVNLGAQHMRKESVKPGAEEGVSGMPGSVAGGLSMTGCLADFSLYIFHPYGGAKKPGGSSSGIIMILVRLNFLSNWYDF